MAKRNSGKNQMTATNNEDVSVSEEIEETMTPEVSEVAQAIANEDVSNEASSEDANDEPSVDTEEEILASEEEDDSEGDTKERKKRGKRQVIFDCVGNVTLPADIAERNLKAGDQALVADPIAVTMPADDADFDVVKSRNEAIEIFTALYTVAPEIVRGPYYNRKGITSAPRKRETINVTVAKEAEFTAQRGNAIHSFKNLDWKVMVNFTTKPDTVWVFYDTLVDPKQAPKDKSKFQKPTPKFLPISALRDIQRNA